MMSYIFTSNFNISFLIQMFNMGGGLYYLIIHMSYQPPGLASFSITSVAQRSHNPHPTASLVFFFAQSLPHSLLGLAKIIYF